MKVLIADDSILIRNIVKEILSSDPAIEIAGEAANGADAVAKALALRPDVVIMDIDMPLMNGLEATAEISRASSIPVLVFTHNSDPALPFKALERGAADFLLKPDFKDLNRPEYASGLVARLRGLSSRGAASAMRARAVPPPAGPPGPVLSPAAQGASASGGEFPATLPPALMVVVGASTGGPQAVLRLLSDLAAPFHLPIAMVQHIETGFDKGYADWLSAETGHEVALARDGELPLPGRVYVAPTDSHLRFSARGLELDAAGPKVQNQKPSVDVLFRSAAERYGEGALGVLLTGMGRDGAEGCAAIRSREGFTVAQDEASSLIFGMPKAAIAMGAASLVLPLERIGSFVAAVAGAGRR
jgi:two-component system, chemotaxis family, protein-glutamate methylesterase/glutaminase